MKFTLEIKCDNAAFADDLLEAEVAFILKVTAYKVRNGCMAGPLSDSNGNRVGSFGFKS